MSKWQGFYSTAQVSRLAQVPLSTLYAWRKQRIIRPSVQVITPGGVADEGYSYADLTIIRILRALREEHLDMRSASYALRHLFERLGPPSKGWADARVYVAGNKIYAEKEDEWETTAATHRGQKVATQLFGDFFPRLRDLEEPGSILIPEEFVSAVEINPDVMGGEPVIRDTRLPVATVSALVDGGWTYDELARTYHPISRDRLKRAVEYDRYLNRGPAKTRKVTA